MMTTRKFNMIKNRSGYANYPTTFASIMKNIPEELKSTLTVAQLVTLIDCMSKSYNRGKVSAGAEVIDRCVTDGAVFVDCLNSAIEWKKDGNEWKAVIAHPEDIPEDC